MNHETYLIIRQRVIHGLLSQKMIKSIDLSIIFDILLTERFKGGYHEGVN
ncbi:MAG: hypothetical protein OEZ31_10035 [Nitrospirota bacterium]|nr:hypothetical protein [Nitrospirota bacterium]MDH5769279.1 hypothetical protein [Nitrospirota bacterium]